MIMSDLSRSTNSAASHWDLYMTYCPYNFTELCTPLSLLRHHALGPLRHRTAVRWPLSTTSYRSLSFVDCWDTVNYMYNRLILNDPSALDEQSRHFALALRRCTRDTCLSRSAKRSYETDQRLSSAQRVWVAVVLEDPRDFFFYVLFFQR